MPLLTSTQFDDWMAYHAVEPFGQHRTDLMAGIVAAANESVWTSAESATPDPYKFIPGYDDGEATEEDIAAAAMAMAQSCRGINRGR